MPGGAIVAEAAAAHEQMDVRVVMYSGCPGMQDRHDGGDRADVAFVAGQFTKGGGDGPHEDPVERFLFSEEEAT